MYVHAHTDTPKQNRQTDARTQKRTKDTIRQAGVYAKNKRNKKTKTKAKAKTKAGRQAGQTGTHASTANPKPANPNQTPRQNPATTSTRLLSPSTKAFFFHLKAILPPGLLKIIKA